MNGAHFWSETQRSLTRDSPRPILHISVVSKGQGVDEDMVMGVGGWRRIYGSVQIHHGRLGNFCGGSTDNDLGRSAHERRSPCHFP